MRITAGQDLRVEDGEWVTLVDSWSSSPDRRRRIEIRPSLIRVASDAVDCPTTCRHGSGTSSERLMCPGCGQFAGIPFGPSATAPGARVTGGACKSPFLCPIVPTSAGFAAHGRRPGAPAAGRLPTERADNALAPTKPGSARSGRSARVREVDRPDARWSRRTGQLGPRRPAICAAGRLERRQAADTSRSGWVRLSSAKADGWGLWRRPAPTPRDRRDARCCPERG